MLSGLSGSLLSNHYAERVLQFEFSGELGESLASGAHKLLERWWSHAGVQLGPASSLRTIWNLSAVPLAEHLGFSADEAPHAGDVIRSAAITSADARVALVAGDWTMPLDRLWRTVVRDSAGKRTAWSICTNGRQLRLIDTERSYSKAFLEFDLQAVVENPLTFRVFWAVLRADAFRAPHGRPPLIRRIVEASARHGHAVGRSLRAGVVAAVEHLLAGLGVCGRRDLASVCDDALTIVYRTLFLMFAEARGLVPNWHPLYREHYTIEALRDRIDRPGPCPGVWETVQAIARLAHRGCHAGTLVVPPFNGRLFSPTRAPLADSCAIEDEHARRALSRLSVTTIKSRRSRIDYRDLGVEHLGAVYESILDYRPVRASPNAAVTLQRGGDQRKTTGSFYTPQPLTDFLVRRTLHPLVADASPDGILSLRVVDPAMGSGAFLVSACRYLAGAYERALIRKGMCQEVDLDDNDRAAFRRQIAQRCLFGVDLNPTAVHLASLSLWLATLASNKPLSFLDHRLVCGNSLLGASPADVARQPPTRRARQVRHPDTPLFQDSDLEASLAHAVDERRWLAETGDESADVVREKERRLAAVRSEMRWKAIADLWCACWMWPSAIAPPTSGVFAAMVDAITSGVSRLPVSTTATLLDRARQVASERRFFHWVLEFPEIYCDAQGRALPDPGFDAVLGNPPWDVLRAATGEKGFFRESGIYRHLGSGHINRYQLFVERALMLAKRGGRIGLVLPSGFATDHTAATLRRRLMTVAEIDTITTFDNRRAIFPIHRSVRFMICTAKTGKPTTEIACRFGIHDVTLLESIPDGDRQQESHPITLTPALLAALSGGGLAIPQLRSPHDVRILESVVQRVPRLDDPHGWNVRFGRELNATDDRPHFHQRASGLPVIEGKHIAPFRVHVDRTTARVSRQTALRLLHGPLTFMKPRLAYRDVASPTNRLSLIAAIVPAEVVTTHTLFCLKTPLSKADQAFLCGMLNSFVANYLIRLMMTTHLGSATVEALRMPKPLPDSPHFAEIVRIVRALEARDTPDNYARLQALAAACYKVTAEDFAHVLSTFPLIADSDRARAMWYFETLTREETCGSA